MLHRNTAGCVEGLHIERGRDMAGLGDTIRKLTKARGQLGILNTPANDYLTETARFGSNPGALKMLSFVPDNLPPRAPLVVVLHGCTQNAAAYDHGAGWSQLAGRHGFAVLCPEQVRANNANLCFNWFNPSDVSRLGGEAESIHQMVVAMLASHRLDPARVFVTGLSAGGAMTAAMLACYPETFAAGAVIAGLPYGAATSIQSAFEAMHGGRSRPAQEWGDLVRAASSHRGRFPSVQIWQGTADTTVRPANATELIKQWSNVHGIAEQPTGRDVQDQARHETWTGPDGRTVIESYLVPGLAHGTPLDTADLDADHAVGHIGPHMLDADIASTWHIAQSWGLLTKAAQSRSEPHIAKANKAEGGPGTVIEKALRAAGLLR